MKRINISILVLLMASMVYAAERGKIAVGMEGKTLTAEVSAVAARSPYFSIFDIDGNLLEVVDNPYQAVKGGAGRSIVPFLAEKGVTFVVAGQFGKNMIQAMNAKGIAYFEMHGSAGAAIKKVLEARR